MSPNQRGEINDLLSILLVTMVCFLFFLILIFDLIQKVSNGHGAELGGVSGLSEGF